MGQIQVNVRPAQAFHLNLHDDEFFCFCFGISAKRDDDDAIVYSV